jgi:hypothetical protein
MLHHDTHQDVKSFFYDCSHQLENEEAKQSSQEMQQLCNSEANAGSNSGNSPILKDSKISALHLQQSVNIIKINLNVKTKILWHVWLGTQQSTPVFSSYTTHLC